jgi:spermidine synthase
MSDSLCASDSAIFSEMMSHPALFTHPHPKKLVIISEADNNILPEVLKHANVRDIALVTPGNPSLSLDQHNVTLYSIESNWINDIAPNSIDIVINASSNITLLPKFHRILHEEGILIQQSASPLQLVILKSLIDQLRTAGFYNPQILNFPQPSFSSGWRSALMVAKSGNFRRIREKIVFNKTFKTYYYNLDTHKASLVLPEFMREEQII